MKSWSMKSTFMSWLAQPQAFFIMSHIETNVELPLEFRTPLYICPASTNLKWGKMSFFLFIFFKTKGRTLNTISNSGIETLDQPLASSICNGDHTFRRSRHDDANTYCQSEARASARCNREYREMCCSLEQTGTIPIHSEEFLSNCGPLRHSGLM